MTTTASGLQYEDTVEGTGAEAVAGKKVSVPLVAVKSTPLVAVPPEVAKLTVTVCSETVVRPTVNTAFTLPVSTSETVTSVVPMRLDFI